MQVKLRSNVSLFDTRTYGLRCLVDRAGADNRLDSDSAGTCDRLLFYLNCLSPN